VAHSTSGRATLAGPGDTQTNDEKGSTIMYTLRSVRFHTNEEGKEMAFVRLMPEDGETLADVVPAIAFGDAMEELQGIGKRAEVDVDLYEGKKGMILTDIMAV